MLYEQPTFFKTYICCSMAEIVQNSILIIYQSINSKPNNDEKTMEYDMI